MEKFKEFRKYMEENFILKNEKKELLFFESEKEIENEDLRNWLKDSYTFPLAAVRWPDGRIIRVGFHEEIYDVNLINKYFGYYTSRMAWEDFGLKEIRDDKFYIVLSGERNHLEDKIREELQLAKVDRNFVRNWYKTPSGTEVIYQHNWPGFGSYNPGTPYSEWWIELDEKIIVDMEAREKMTQSELVDEFIQYVKDFEKVAQ